MASRQHILVVEDEPAALDVLQTTLGEFYRVSTAGTVGDACAFLRNSEVDLVLVDWGLPDGHGDAVATYAETRHVAAIMMSGYAAGMDEMKSNRWPHLMKPFELKTLSEIVSSALSSTHPHSDQPPAEPAAY